MKLYYPKIAYNKALRAQMFPLLKPFIKKGEFTDEQRQAMYAISERDVTFTGELEQADIAILPLSWNYYVKEKKQSEAIKFIEEAKNAGIPLWVVLLGDAGLSIPELKNTWVFRASGYRTQLPKTHHGLPIFITDPLKAYGHPKTVEVPRYTHKPKLGFCGLANDSRWDALKGLVKIALKNTAYHLHCYPNTPEHLLAAPYFRYQCLQSLKTHSEIDDNFIIRKQYRAGAVSKAGRERSTTEYYENMNQAQYIVCARGAGNFSVRLYETLAMGRIPIYIHTDGLLPLEDKIDWKKHMLWIEKEEVPLIAEKVLAFHQQLNQESLTALCHANRTLWESHLRMGPFFKTHFL